MKQYFLTGLLYLIFIHNSIAQLSFDVFSGVNVSWQTSRLEDVSNESFDDNYNRIYGEVIKPFLGLRLNHKVNGFLDLNFELQYTEKGQKSNTGSYKEGLKYLKYLQSFDINVWKNLHFEGGIYWAYLLSSAFEGLGPQTLSNREDWDSGIVTAISHQYKRFTVRFVYCYSYVKLYKENLFNNSNQFLGSANRYNRSIQIGLGFNLMKKKSTKIEKSLF